MAKDKRLSPIPEAHLTKLHCQVFQVRIGRRLTQDDLADKAGVTRKTVYAIEMGKSWPTLIVALKIAKALDMPVEKLFRLAP